VQKQGRAKNEIATGPRGLQQLIRDAQHGRADFDCILVYDVIIRFCSILTTLYPLLRNAKLALGLKHSGQLLIERRLFFSDLAPDIRKVIDRRGDLTKQMTQIFIEGQQEQDILRRLFTALPSL
jgi:hypothetical protein